MDDKYEMSLALLALALLGHSSSELADPAICRMPFGPVVPNQETARAIGEAVITALQRPEKSGQFVLDVEGDDEHPSGWIVFQSLPPTRSTDQNTIIATMGGGGLAMRIDRCTGEISGMYLQR